MLQLTAREQPLLVAAATGALVNLTLHEGSRVQIVREGAVGPLVRLASDCATGLAAALGASGGGADDGGEAAPSGLMTHLFASGGGGGGSTLSAAEAEATRRKISGYAAQVPLFFYY